jgi:hypothetical protein
MLDSGVFLPLQCGIRSELSRRMPLAGQMLGTLILLSFIEGWIDEAWH